MLNSFLHYLFCLLCFMLCVAPSLADAPNRASIGLYANYSNYLQAIPHDIKKHFVFHTEAPDPWVVLSFDDGPLANTDELMEVLQEYNAPASFFVVCNQLQGAHKDWYDDPLFTFGIHSYSHRDYSDMSLEEINADIGRCQSRLDELDMHSYYFRPTYGIISQALVEALEQAKLWGILWNIDSLDWDGLHGIELREQVKNSLSPGSIILFHDQVASDDLRHVIEDIREEGYSIVPLRRVLRYRNIVP